MRETRLSGSEGGRFEFNRFSLPLLLDRPFGAHLPTPGDSAVPAFGVGPRSPSIPEDETVSGTVFVHRGGMVSGSAPG